MTLDEIRLSLEGPAIVSLKGDEFAGLAGNGAKKAIEVAAQGVLDARAAHPGQTLADLYDPLYMPPDLLKAHQHLDALVDKAYGKKFANDAERVAHLFDLYAYPPPQGAA